MANVRDLTVEFRDRELRTEIRAKTRQAALMRALGELPTVLYNSLSSGTRKDLAAALELALERQGLWVSDLFPYLKPEPVLDHPAEATASDPYTPHRRFPMSYFYKTEATNKEAAAAEDAKDAAAATDEASEATDAASAATDEAADDQKAAAKSAAKSDKRRKR